MKAGLRVGFYGPASIGALNAKDPTIYQIRTSSSGEWYIPPVVRVLTHHGSKS